MDWGGLDQIGRYRLQWGWIGLDLVELGYAELDWTELGLDQRLDWRWGGLGRKRLREFGFGLGLGLTRRSTGEDWIGNEWIDLDTRREMASDSIGSDWTWIWAWARMEP